MIGSSLRAYRVQLRLRPSGERVLRRDAGMARQGWNRALEEHRQRHARGEKYASDADLCRWLTAPRGAPATAWLGDPPVHCQQQVPKQPDLANNRFLDKKGGFPTFKRYGDAPGLRFPDPKQFELDPGNARIRLPTLGGLRLRQSQAVTGALRNLTVRREGTKWFASIQTRLAEVVAEVVAELDVEPTLGIDLGLTAFAATSEAELVAPLNAPKQQRRLKHAQRAVSRKVKGSSNRKKAIQRVGEIHRRIAHQRSDWPQADGVRGTKACARARAAVRPVPRPSRARRR